MSHEILIQQFKHLAAARDHLVRASYDIQAKQLRLEMEGLAVKVYRAYGDLPGGPTNFGEHAGLASQALGNAEYIRTIPQIWTEHGYGDELRNPVPGIPAWKSSDLREIADDILIALADTSRQKLNPSSWHGIARATAQLWMLLTLKDWGFTGDERWNALAELEMSMHEVNRRFALVLQHERDFGS